jgi:hypothetical protein
MEEDIPMGKVSSETNSTVKKKGWSDTIKMAVDNRSSSRPPQFLWTGCTIYPLEAPRLKLGYHALYPRNGNDSGRS